MTGPALARKESAMPQPGHADEAPVEPAGNGNWSGGIGRHGHALGCGPCRRRAAGRPTTRTTSPES